MTARRGTVFGADRIRKRFGFPSLSDYKRWLDPAKRTHEEIGNILKPYPADEMEAYEVSTLVNKPANDVPECVVGV